jgi:biotin carboxylase
LNPENPTVLCIASYEKGHAFLAELAAQGCNVVLMTAHKHREAAWPRPAVDEIHTFSDEPKAEEVLHLAQKVARHLRIDRVIALDEFDLEAAALIREEMRLPGMGYSTTRNFRDKLAMRVRAKAVGIAVPDFIGVLNDSDLRHFLAETRGPWLLKPRTSASAIGIRRIEYDHDLWRALQDLGDEQVNYLLECFVPGNVYHVDSITWDRRVLAQSASVYGKPPMALMQGGGVFTTRTLDRRAADTATLRSLDAEVVPALGMVSGVTHSEYIRSDADGSFYFLETAARVGGAYIAELVEFSTGMNPWVEWARIEAALIHNSGYTLPLRRDAYAGSVICLAKQEWPDLSGYDDPEIVLRMERHHHAGLMVQADNAYRVKQLVDSYGERFAEDFCASMPAPDRPTA